MIILKNGDILRLRCTFQHKGVAYSGAKIYAAIGHKGTAFSEVSGMNGTTVITGIREDADWADYVVNVDIPISNIGGAFGAAPGSDYEVYAKMVSIPGTDIYWYGPLNDITLSSPVEFQNLNVTYQKA